MPTTLRPLLTTGVSGLVGSDFAKKYANVFAIDNLDISHPTRPVDITDLSAVLRVFEQSTAQHVIHLAAFTDVTKAWEQSGDKSGLAYRVNVLGTQNIITACQQFSKQLIYISTAYVFDGNKTTPYTEDDPVSPIEWYGQTKAEAESLVMSAAIPWTVLRIDQPFGAQPGLRPDIIRRIAAGLQNGSLPPQFTDHTFGPTFIDDFSTILHWVVTNNITGLYHASSGETWTDYDFALLLQNTLNLAGTIKPGNLAAYQATIQRPYQKNTALNTTKLTAQLPFSLHTIAEALTQIQL